MADVIRDDLNLIVFRLYGSRDYTGALDNTGPAGEKGDKGDPGAAGATGDKGDPGVAGATRD